ncbi:MAG: preprotein translocase subunit SecE [Oscillospiraceae bacterium]|nr:preprotein translocase subunit SecE [Oscillospiraceae bacterium]
MAEASKKENFFVRTFKRIKKWFREMKSELKKVVWPTKKQILNNVLITLACVLVVGVFIWVFDLGSNLAVEGIISLVKG